jgi:glycosyltransferase involved in cell wall biosynthesis
MLYPERPAVTLAERGWGMLDEHDFIVFNHGRHLWRTYEFGLRDFDRFGSLNRNDRLIRAFAAFVKTTRYRKPLLVMFEYGPDVEASKRLVGELGIERQVQWMPKMERRDILLGLRRANIATGYFRENMCGIGGVSNEALACGVPFLTYTNGALNDPQHQIYEAPMLDALTEDQILEVLRDYERDPETFRQLGRRGPAWFDAHAGKGLAERYARMLRLLHADRSLTHDSEAIRAIFTQPS